MAHPFGGHPKLGRFVEWATDHGCAAEIKVRVRRASGQPYTVLEITNPKGGRVVVAEPDLEEYLAPSEVAYLQRRLGIATPFASTPEMTPEPDKGGPKDP